MASLSLFLFLRSLIKHRRVTQHCSLQLSDYKYCLLQVVLVATFRHQIYFRDSVHNSHWFWILGKTWWLGSQEVLVIISISINSFIQIIYPNYSWFILINAPAIVTFFLMFLFNWFVNPTSGLSSILL